MADEVPIYREEVTAILIALADVGNHLREIKEILKDDGEEEEEET